MLSGVDSMSESEWLRRKWRAIRNSLAALALAALAVTSFLLLHAWGYSDAAGHTGKCGSVVTGSSHDTLTNLRIAEYPALLFCSQQRSSHEHEAIASLVFGVLVGGCAVWSHRQADRGGWLQAEGHGA